MPANWFGIIRRQDRVFARNLKPKFDDVVKILPAVLDNVELSKYPGMSKIHDIYIPEMVLALHNVYLEAGLFINKTYFMNALKLATDVADPDKHILDTFRATGRLSEYVDAVATASRTILGATQEGAKDLEIWTVGK